MKRKMKLSTRYKVIMWRLLTYLLDKGWNDQDSFFCRWKWHYIVCRQHALYFLGICCHCGWRPRRSLEYCEKCFYQQTGFRLETKESFLDRYRGKGGFLGRVVLMLDRLWLKKQVIGVLRITKEERSK